MWLFNRNEKLECEIEELRRENDKLSNRVKLLILDVNRAVHEKNKIRSRCKPDAREMFDKGIYGLLYIDRVKDNGFKLQMANYCQYCNEFEPVIESVECTEFNDLENSNHRYLRTVTCEHAQRCAAIRESTNGKSSES